MKKLSQARIQTGLATRKARVISFLVTTMIFGTGGLWLYISAKNGQLTAEKEGWQAWLKLAVFVPPFLISVAVSEWYQGFFMTRNDFLEIWKLALAVIVIPVVGNLPEVNDVLAMLLEVDAKLIAICEFAIPLVVIYLLSVPFILFKFRYTPPPEPTITDEEYRKMKQEKYEMFVQPPPPEEEETDAFGRPF